MIEHRFTIESRVTTTHSHGIEMPVEQTRHVCSCGWATRWNKSPKRLRRERDRHALEGQLAHTIDLPDNANTNAGPGGRVIDAT